MLATSFDDIAAEYDALWNCTAIGASQRRAVWRWIDPLFEPGQHVLDIGCGNGEDAVHLESRAIKVDAIDASARMVDIARSRGINARRMRVEDLGSISAQYHGVLADFGVLNCVERLEHVAWQLARLIRPGGYAALCLMGPCCLWEVAFYAVRGQFEKAFRRFRSGMNATSLGVDVHYPSTTIIRTLFSENFRLTRWCGIGLCVPPSYISIVPDSVIRGFAGVDHHLGHRPGLRALADHRLYVLERL